MTEKTMKEKLAEAKKIYLMDDFKKFMRNMQGLTDDDFKKSVPSGDCGQHDKKNKSAA